MSAGDSLQPSRWFVVDLEHVAASGESGTVLFERVCRALGRERDRAGAASRADPRESAMPGMFGRYAGDCGPSVSCV